MSSRKLNLSKYFHNILFRMFDLVFRIPESIAIKRFSKEDPIYPPVFIIGAPRTGSTVIYQAITNYFAITYPDNIVAKLYRNPFFGFWLSSMLFRDSPHNIYRSEFGNTQGFGEHGPNEFGDFWYRWFPRDKHFLEKEEVPKKSLSEIGVLLKAVINRFSRPIIFKNLNMGQRLRVVKEFAPEAKFIFVKRNYEAVVNSILLARERKGIKPGEWWSVMPKNYRKILKISDDIEMVTKSVFEIEKTIVEDLKLFPSGSVMTVDYDQFLNDPEKVLASVQNFIGGLEKRKEYMPVEIRKGEDKTGDKYSGKINKEVRKYDWENYEE